MQHGIYVDWGAAFDYFRDRNLPIIRWMRGYETGRYYFRYCLDGDDRHIFYKHGGSAPPPLSRAESVRLDQHMATRVDQTRADKVLFSEKPGDPESVLAQLAFKHPDKPMWAVFTHLNWDAHFASESMLFESTTAWTLETVRHAIENTEVNWIIRVHPAEKIMGTRESCSALIAEHFPSLPGHVRVLGPEDPLNTYGFLPLLHGGITIRGTVGMELALLRKPVILAGTAHYGHSDYTLQPGSIEAYVELLRQTQNLPNLNDAQLDAARRYAYDFFVRRQLELPFGEIGTSVSSMPLRTRLNYSLFVFRNFIRCLKRPAEFNR
jgi:hypothetical protein